MLRKKIKIQRVTTDAVKVAKRSEELREVNIKKLKHNDDHVFVWESYIN